MPCDARQATWPGGRRIRAPSSSRQSRRLRPVRGSGLLTRKSVVQGVLVEGIVPAREQRTTALADYLDPTLLDTLHAGSRHALLGAELARTLGVEPGDSLSLMVPDFDGTGRARAPRYERVPVTGTFHVGMHQYDARLLLVALGDAQAWFQTGDTVSGLRVRFADAAGAPRCRPRSRPCARPWPERGRLDPVSSQFLSPSNRRSASCSSSWS